MLPTPSHGDIHVRLGTLLHADVGVPGRRLEWLHGTGWVSVPVPVAVRLPPKQPDKRRRITALTLVAAVLAAAAVPSSHPPPAPASAPVVPSVSVPVVATPVAAVPLSASAVLPSQGVPAPTLHPMPVWATSAPLAARPPATDMTAGALAWRDESPLREPPRRRTKPAAPTSSPGRQPAPPVASAASAPTPVFNEPEPVSPDVLVAIQDARTIVVPGSKGLPTPVRVGERLPSGARLLGIDPVGGEARTDRGVIRLE